MSRFDLDKAVATWRHHLAQNRTFRAQDLDELESHLRDHIEALTRQGHRADEAFDAAVRRMGHFPLLESEYKKVRFGRSKRKPNTMHEFTWQWTMFRNYLKTALRNLKRHKGFAVINIGGLAVGLAACLLIGLFIQDELAYDEFLQKQDRIYRLGSSTVGWPYGRILEAEYPEVEDVVYMRAWPTYSILHEEQHYFETMYYADSGFFDLFEFPLLEGNAETALETAYSVVLSSSMAERFFGQEPALGRILTLADSLQFTVTGVTEIPERSHIQFDLLLSFETLRAVNPDWYEAEMSGGWIDLNVINYVLLREGTDAAAFAAKIRDLPQERAAEYLNRWGSRYQLGFESLKDVYLYSEADNLLGPKGDINSIYLLSLVGLFLLLIAAVNFINLATARSTQRAREVGVRKVVGSDRGSLIRQFLGESFLTCMVATVLSIVVVWLMLPLFNDLTTKQYGMYHLLSWKVVLILLGLMIVVGGLAGLYPAFTLSSFRPVDVLKGHFATGRRGRRLRQTLVVFQFAISGILVVGTLAVLNQLRYMQSQDLGFDAEQVLVLDARQAPRPTLIRRNDAIRQTLAGHPAVKQISATWTVPGRSGWRGQLSFPEGFADDQSISLEYVAVDHHFFETLGLEMVAGRDFDPDFGTDAETAVIINVAAAEVAGWTTPEKAIGKRFASPGSGKPEGVVIGVVEDYHHHGLQETIGPMMFGIQQNLGLLALRIEASEATSVIEHIEQTWPQFFTGYPYSYFFLDQDFDNQYATERRLMLIFSTFAGLAIWIACLGLFGLVTFTATRRTKEIGVRKVLGASVADIVMMLSKDFLKLILIAFLVAVPPTYFAMQRWLEAFAYRTSISADIFLIGGSFMMLIALLTVSYQAVRAAWTDPVKSLRYE